MPRRAASTVAQLAPRPDDQADRRATIVGDFSDGTRFSDHGRSYEFGTKDGKPFMTVAFGAAKPETFDRLHARRETLSGLPLDAARRTHLRAAGVLACRERSGGSTGRRSRRFPTARMTYGRSGTSTASTATAPISRRATTSPRRRYKSTWTEMGIGCEACHGPGREHVRLMEAWEKNPARSRPTTTARRIGS